MKIDKHKINFEEALLCLAFTMLILLMSAQVFSRYVLNKAIGWSEEVSRISFVWSIFLGIDLAAKKERHIRVTFQLRMFPLGMRRIISILADFIWLAFSGILAYISLKYVIDMFKFPYYSQTLGINLAYAYIIVPFGFTMMTIRILLNTIKLFSKDADLPDSAPADQWKEG